MSRTQPETRIQRDIQDMLSRDFYVKVIKVHGDQYTEIGTPDLLACWNGRMVCIEVKVPGEEPTMIQVQRLNEWQRAGALVGCAHSKEEALLILIGEIEWNGKAMQKKVSSPDSSKNSSILVPRI